MEGFHLCVKGPCPSKSDVAEMATKVKVVVKIKTRETV